MAQTWYTKEDMLKDLEEATPGLKAAGVDDSYLLYGHQPPRPRVFNDEEEEIELRYGRAPLSDMLAQGDAPKPDLLGITESLRMVQNCERSSDEESSSSPKKRIIISKPSFNKMPSANTVKRTINTKKVEVLNSGPTFNQNTSNKFSKTEKMGLISDSKKISNGRIQSSSIIKSKLNPNVKEFIPRRTPILSNQNATCTLNGTSLNSTLSINSSASVASNDTKNEIDNAKHIKQTSTVQIDKEHSKEEKKQIAMMLKSQIPAKNDTFEEKQKTNSAIVKLLKLYAEPKPEKPLKLLTPDFFEKSLAVKPDDKKSVVHKPKNTDRSIERIASLHGVDEVNDIDVLRKSDEVKNDLTKAIRSEAAGESQSHDDINKEISDDVAIATVDKCKSITIRKENNDQFKSFNDDIEEFNESTQLTPDLAEFVINENVKPDIAEPQDPYMESIAKVNNWLNDKPVVTVNEEKKKTMSPVLNASAVAYKRKDSSTCKSPSEVTEKKISKTSVAEYKPSSYAEELHKKYSERNKATTPVPTLNIWEKLEADLKQRDVEIKKRNKKS